MGTDTRPPAGERALEHPPINIIIPFYKSAGLASNLLESLQGAGAELAQLRCSVIAINDSPGDADLQAYLPNAIHELSAWAPCELIANERNLGFIASANLVRKQPGRQTFGVKSRGTICCSILRARDLITTLRSPRARIKRQGPPTY